MSKEEALALKDKLKNARICKTPPHALYQIKTSDTTITAYNSGKVVFQGNGADFYDDINPKQNNKNIFPQCGSDEVGTGDFFGPVVVCATCVKEEDTKFLRDLKAGDSKGLSDETIKKIAPLLMNKLTYSLLILDNKKYNQIHLTNNMNAIKAKLHNQALLLLRDKLTIDINQTIIDQFTPPKSYFNYLKNENRILKDITFETKAENKYLSVACASIIARYAFLIKMEEMNNLYHFDFLKGASDAVDKCALKFANTYGLDKLNEVSKIHFKNYEKVKELMK